jgi:nucleoside-diphosphate-sugar epimerase
MATRVAVTGASGNLGRAVVKELLEHDYEVVSLDRTPPPEHDGSRFVRVELSDYGQVAGALTAVDGVHSGLDAVVHLAAIPAPGLLPNAATFTNNITASYNVFAAARATGIRNVVWASSETVLGLPFDTPPPYIPLDEEYAARPESSYSLGKHLEEKLAAQFARWDPETKLVGLRFSNVMNVEDYAEFPAFESDPALRKWNLWSYIDSRDGAQAVRLALEYEAKGVEVFIIASPDTVMSTASSDLAAQVFPDVEVRRPLGEHESLMSVEKARRLLGYKPQHTWRDHV